MLINSLRELKQVISLSLSLSCSLFLWFAYLENNSAYLLHPVQIRRWEANLNVAVTLTLIIYAFWIYSELLLFSELSI